MAHLRVVALAGSAIFQDLGRLHTSSGVPRSGAFDPFAHAAATMLVGGGPPDASIELVGALDVEAGVPVTCAVAGQCEVGLDGRPLPAWTAFDLPAGARLSVVTRGRAYLAVAGGFPVEPILGSRSTCVLGPVGPPPIGVGDMVPLAARSTSRTAGDFCRPPRGGSPLAVVPGPHLGLEPTVARVVAASRIGILMRVPRRSAAQGGPAGAAALHGAGGRGVAVHAALPSLGVLPGTIQVLPSGQWVVLGPDSGTMGGYPVVAVVATADVGRLAHLVPGDEVRLMPVPADRTRTPEHPVVMRIAQLHE